MFSEEEEEEVDTESPVYKEGLERGIKVCAQLGISERYAPTYAEGFFNGFHGRVEERVPPMLKLFFERRLRRGLLASERAMIIERFETLGATRLMNVTFELSPKALAAWLADPAAT